MSTFNRKRQIMEHEPSVQDEIMEMARQTGWHDALLDVSFVLPMLTDFAKLVAAKEREACAKVCDEFAKDSDWPTVDNCAAAIRARGES
jgi:hypothetical protein